MSITCIFYNENALFQYCFPIKKVKKIFLMSQVVWLLINVSKLPILTTVSTDHSAGKGDLEKMQAGTQISSVSMSWEAKG